MKALIHSFIFHFVPCLRWALTHEMQDDVPSDPMHKFRRCIKCGYQEPHIARQWK